VVRRAATAGEGNKKKESDHLELCYLSIIVKNAFPGSITGPLISEVILLVVVITI
jgi:hypothetical protein